MLSEKTLTVLLFCFCCCFCFCSSDGVNNADHLYDWITDTTLKSTSSFDNDFLNQTLQHFNEQSNNNNNNNNDNLNKNNNSTSESNLELTCAQQLKELQMGIDQREDWALQFIDSWGKIPAGLYYGHFMEMGQFEECLNIAHPSTTNKDMIQGKYCLSKIPASASMPALQIGICLPAECRADDINVIFKNYLKTVFRLNVTGDAQLVKENDCTAPEHRKFQTLDWIAIAIIVILALLMLCSSCYYYYTVCKNSKPNPWFNSFSVPENLKHLLTIDTSQSNPNVIPCLNGIRSLALIWVIFGHCYLMLLLSPNINSLDIIEWAQTPFSMLIQSATITVDTFFFLSGLLLVLLTMREMDRNGGKLNVPLMYLHRFLRLTPVLAFSVLIYMTLYRYMDDGPVWQKAIAAYKLCDETWWATLLYVQNYAAAGKMCLGHSWYLAVDMQFYIISPIFLMAIWRWKKKALYAIGLLGLLLFACLFTIIVVNNFIVFNKAGNLGADNDQMRKVYYSSHARASPWLIGLIFGYYLRKQTGRRVHLGLGYVIAGWALCFSLLASCLFAMFPEAHRDTARLTTLEGAFYLSLSRIAWPLALSWLVFACVNNYAGPINQFLSHPLWQPLSKLSYCMYIVHWLVETVNAGRIKTNTNFSNYDVILRFWGDFGITLLASTLLYLAVEAPFLRIENCLFKRKTKPVVPADNSITTAKTISQQQLCE